MQTIVAKFGGTSIGTGERMLAVKDIVLSVSPHSNLVLVTSAMSPPTSKTTGTTTKLIRAADNVLAATIPDIYIDIINDIQSTHITHAKDCIKTPEILKNVVSDIVFYCERLRGFLAAAEIIEELSPRSRDVIISTGRGLFFYLGEKLSARILTGVLVDNGISAEFVDLHKLVDGRGADVGTLNQTFYDSVVVKLKAAFDRPEAVGYCIPVVTGFFGQVPGSLLLQIGRGYSDLTAALIAVALSASELHIYKV
jgi:aspartate kinase